MKKYLSLIMCVVMLLTLMPNVMATGAGDAVSIVCEDVTCKPGEQVEVAVKVVNNPGFMLLSMTPVIDPALTLVKVTNGELISDLTQDRQYVWTGNNDVTATGVLMTFTFEVAENVPLGEYAVDFVVRACSNEAEQQVAYTVESGKVTVAEQVEIVCADVTCKPGAQVEVAVNVVNNPGFMLLSMTPVIDPALTLVKVTNSTLISDLVQDRQYVWTGNNDVATEGLLMTFTFAVAENVPAGEYEVGFIVRACSNESEQEVACTVKSGKVSVVEKLQATTIDQFTYTTSGTELTITGYIGANTDVVIGSTYEIGGTEYTVTAIAKEAFYANTVPESIVLPDTLKVIGISAFEACNLTKIVIPASVTTIGEYAFYDCIDMTEVVVLSKNAEIGEVALGYVAGRRYPEKMAGFVVNGLGGSTAEAYADVEGFTFKSVLKIAAASLSLQHNLAVNYKIEKTLIEEYGFTAPYIVAQMNGKTATLDQYTVDGDYYVFSFRDIAPNQMNDTITATLYATCGGSEYATEAKDYSVATYCYSMLEECAADEYAKLRTLLVDLLHYGAASQVYTNYKTDALVDASLTAAQLAWGTNADPAMSTVLNTTYATAATPTAKWTGASLNLKEAVVLRLMFNAENVAGLSVKIESGSNVWIIPADQFQVEEGEYVVYFNGLDAGQMREEVYLTICQGDTAVSNTARYSIGSYAYEMQNSSIAGLAGLVKAMMKYGDAAYAYVN